MHSAVISHRHLLQLPVCSCNPGHAVPYCSVVSSCFDLSTRLDIVSPNAMIVRNTVFIGKSDRLTPHWFRRPNSNAPRRSNRPDLLPISRSTSTLIPSQQQNGRLANNHLHTGGNAKCPYPGGRLALSCAGLLFSLLCKGLSSPAVSRL